MHQNILLTNTESYDTMKMKSALTTSQGAFQNKKKDVCPMCSLDEEQFIKQNNKIKEIKNETFNKKNTVLFNGGCIIRKHHVGLC